MFQSLSRSDLEHLAAAVTLTEFADKAVVIRQGDVGNCMYIISSGAARVIINGDGESSEVVDEGIEVRQLQHGDAFGEKALLEDVPRTANVVVRCTRASKSRAERN